MLTVIVVVAYAAVLAGIIFIVDAVVGFFRVTRGIDDTAVQRRLARTGIDRPQGATHLELLRKAITPERDWHRHVPFYSRLRMLIMQSGVNISLDRAIIIAGVVALCALLVFALALSPADFPIYLPLSIVAGVGGVIGYLWRARSQRRLKFEEQLPDAIDLMVRSLRVGHPVSAALSVIGQEMQAPISTEFQIAYNEVTYGQDVPTAIAAIAQRVFAPDLGYLTVAIQIQQESGGNLAESLAKLSGVIRDRFRMFRKVKAITAEGRFSAWLLSFFPLGIALVLQLIRPDYYTQVADYPYFPYLVAAAIVMLIVNLIAMRVLTTIKV